MTGPAFLINVSNVNLHVKAQKDVLLRSKVRLPQINGIQKTLKIFTLYAALLSELLRVNFSLRWVHFPAWDNKARHSHSGPFRGRTSSVTGCPFGQLVVTTTRHVT